MPGIPLKAPDELDWNAIRKMKPGFLLEHQSDIDELSKRYLQSEAIDTSEQGLVQNLYSLWKITQAQKAQIKKSHAKKINKIVMKAVFKFWNQKTDGKSSEYMHEKKQQAQRHIIPGWFQSKMASETLSVPAKERDLERARGCISRAVGVLEASHPILASKQEINEALKFYYSAEKIYLKYDELDLEKSLLEQVYSSTNKLLEKNTKYAYLALSKKFLKLARRYGDKKEYEKSADCLSNAATTTPVYYFENMFFDLLYDAFIKISRKETAIAREYMKNKQYVKAAEFYARRCAYHKEAKAYLKAGEITKAAEAYKKKGSYLKAAKLYEGSNDFFNAGECYREHIKHSEFPLKIALAEMTLMFGSLIPIMSNSAAHDGAVQWASLGAFITGIYGMFDSGSFKAGYSITKRLFNATTLKKYKEKILGCYDKHLDALKLKNDHVGVVETSQYLLGMLTPHYWTSGYTDKELLTEADFGGMRTKYASLIGKNLLPALEQAKESPEKTLELLGKNKEAVMRGRSLGEVYELVDALTERCEKRGDSANVEKLSVIQSELLTWLSTTEIGAIMEKSPNEKKEKIRQLYNSAYASRVYQKLEVKTEEEVLKAIEDTARALAFSAYKTQSTLRTISQETKKPIVAAYVLSTGFGLRAPTPSMRQFDDQYTLDDGLLEVAFAGRINYSTQGKSVLTQQQKIGLLKKAFLDDVKKAQTTHNHAGIEEKAARMNAFLETGAKWMERGYLQNLVYQTGYKVPSGGGKIGDGSAAALITDSIGKAAIPLGCPIVIVDHSTIRVANHPTIVNSKNPDVGMGRAIAQIVSRLVEKNPTHKDSVGWLTNLNNWSMGAVLSEVKKPLIVGLNLYQGVEYESIAGRKNLWLPTDDRPFFVGREWVDATVSQKAEKVAISVMDEQYRIRRTDVTDKYWAAFNVKYLELESQNRLDWAKNYKNVVLFDVDGTIVSTKQAFDAALEKGLEVLSDGLKQSGVQKTVPELKKDYEKVRHNARKTMYKYGRYRDMEARLYNLAISVLASENKSGESGVSTMRNSAKMAYEAYFSHLMSNAKVYPEAAACLEKLNKQGYEVVLMTDRRDSELYQLLNLGVNASDGGEAKLKGLVKGAIITNDLLSEIETDIPICRLGMPKENDAYKRIAKLIHPIAMVGDSSTHDVRPAQANGIAGIRVSNGAGYEKVFEALEASAQMRLKAQK